MQRRIPSVTAAILFCRAVCVMGAGAPQAPAPLVEHRPGVGFSTGISPRIEARLLGGPESESAQVSFHAEESPHCCGVAMRREGEVRSLAVAERGPQTLSVGPSTPRVPEGFDLSGVEASVEAQSEELPAAPLPADPHPPLVIVPFKQVRLATVPPPPDRAQWLAETDRSVTLASDSEGETVTRTKKGRLLYGEVEALEDGGKAVVRQEDLVRLEGRQPGSTARAVVGGLTGLAGGFLLAALVSINADVDVPALFWLGSGLGAAAGVAAGGAPDWREASLVPQRAGQVSLQLRPARRSAALALSVRF
jgi:hypothetical protein